MIERVNSDWWMTPVWLAWVVKAGWRKDWWDLKKSQKKRNNADRKKRWSKKSG